MLVYFQFKQLMLKLDPDDPDDEENSKVLSALSAGAVGSTAATTTNQSGTAASSILTEADQVALENYKVCVVRCNVG